MSFLRWQTASETNNEGFEVQWAVAGTQSAVREWKKIGLVKGAGDSFEKQDYQFVHTRPSLGINYYRLKQMDFDGVFEYSNTVNVDVPNFKNSENLRIFPNPTETGTFTLYLPEFETETVQMEMYDHLGRVVRQRSLTDTQTEINVLDLEKGIYLVKAEAGRMVSWARVTVQ